MRNISRFAVLVVMAIIMSASALAAAPGLNVFTGNADPLTFDGMESNPSYVVNAVVADSPFSSEDGKVLFANVKNFEYGFVSFSFNPVLDKDRAYQISFKVYQDADSGFGKYSDLWIMKNGVAGWQIAKNVDGLVPNNAGGWIEHSHFVNTFASLTDQTTGVLDTSDISKILLEWHYDSAAAGAVNQRIYFDDISIVPAYKITYIDEDGTVIRTAYEHIEGTSFKPVLTSSDIKKHILGWSKDNDGTVDETINVAYTDFNLYAIYDNALNIDISADKTLFTSKNEEANITSSLWHRNGTDGITVSYSVTQGAQYVTLTDNGNGSAKVVSKGEGMSVVTCTASTGETETLCLLSEYMTLETVEKIQTVPSISASDFLYDHKGSVYSTTEGAWEFVKATNVPKPDGTYYTNGFLSKSGNVDTSVYKYLLFRVKANQATNFQAAVAVASGSWKYAYPVISNTNGAFVDVCVDISSLASNGSISQWVLGVTNHHNPVYVKDITLSNIPAYEPQLPDVRKIKLLTTISSLEEESEKAAVKAVLFYNKGLGGGIAWKSDDECITIAPDSDGNAVIRAVSNGSATVTAYAQSDESISASFDVTVTGQREKQAVYDLRILFWGASTTKHSPAANLGWYGNWGMAASAEENDYVHKLVSYLEEKYYPSKVTYEIIANANFDAAISAETSATRDWSTQANFLEIENAIKEFRPNIFVTAQTGNMKAETPENVAYNAYKQLYDMVFSYVPDTIVVAQYCGTWHSGMKESFMARLGEDYRSRNFCLLHNDVAGVAEYLAPGFANDAVARHWGDKGHERVAQQCFAFIDPRIPAAIESTYIYIPESIAIEGGDTIDEKGGSLRLTVTTSPSDASDSVTWSVDNGNYAVIGKDGTLTALNNGTVTVTATSDFDETVTATHTVKIINQSDVYTLTYAAGTTDEVTGLPAADDFAGNNYTLSSAIPARAKYDFVGWGLSENAGQTVTVIDVTKNTTVYAIWKKTEGFEFEGTYPEDNGFGYNFSFVNGFHVNVRDSKLWSTCTAGEKVSFITPEIDVENKNFVSFGLVSAYADSSSTVEMTVTTTGGQKTFVYPLTSTALTTYVADISSLAGNVTGVSIYVDAAPADNSMFEIGLDFVRFTPVRELSATDGDFAVSDGDTVIANKQYAGASKISATLADGNRSRFCVTVSSGVAFEFAGTDTVYASAKTKGTAISVNALDFDNNGIYTQSCAKVYVNTADGFAKKNEYSDVLTMYDASSIRTEDPRGIRMKASVKETLAQNSDVAEYGFIIAKKEMLDSGKIRDLVFEDEYVSSKYVVCGEAYSKSKGIHKYYHKEENVEIVTAVLINVPVRKDVYETPLVFRAYIKLEDGTMLYGAKVEKSILDVAKAVYFATGMDDTSRLAAKSILDVCGLEGDTLFLPMDNLFS